MMRTSLRVRLLAAAAVAIVAALVVAGFGLAELFERHVERRIEAELAASIRQLAGRIAIGENGTVTVDAAVGDPRFSRPYGGLYWQIQDGQAVLLRSRSLWDFRLDLPAEAPPPGSLTRTGAAGPEGSRLLVREGSFIYPVPEGDRRLRIAVAVDHHELESARQDFAGEVAPSLALLGLILLAALWVQVGYGLRPLEAVRRGVNAVRSGEASRLDTDRPTEIQPLVREINDLLDAQEVALAQARARAADLAHGLKTPLTVLAEDARRLAEAGHAEMAAELRDLADAMRRHVERELVRARLGAVVGTRRPRTAISEVVERLVRILQRTPRGETLDWRCEMPGEAIAAVDREDLTELLGTLLDNACKWAESTVIIAATVAGGEASIRIADDGPGVPPGQIETLGRRGVRLDRTVQGSGHGLAIAKEIVAAYGGTLGFAAREAGGLAVEVRLPAVRDRAETAPEAI